MYCKFLSELCLPTLNKVERFCFCYRWANYYASGLTETYDLSFLFFLNSTTPSTKANNVWSLPIPTLSPGLCTVPLCLTIMLPAIHFCPPNILTPNRLLSDSRPYWNYRHLSCEPYLFIFFVNQLSISTQHKHYLISVINNCVKY